MVKWLTAFAQKAVAYRLAPSPVTARPMGPLSAPAVVMAVQPGWVPMQPAEIRPPAPADADGPAAGPGQAGQTEEPPPPVVANAAELRRRAAGGVQGRGPANAPRERGPAAFSVPIGDPEAHFLAVAHISGWLRRGLPAG